MRHVILPVEGDGEHRRLPFYLAAEEWVARCLPAGDYFFSWRVDPTVICGRNQEIDKEVNLEYCRMNGIDVVRRRSGGGCVFADRQNFMFSFITDSDKVTEVFARYTSMIAEAICKLGIKAYASGRNDILIGERKVAGNAFYHLPGRSIAHGTMLYDFDPVRIGSAITPSKAKLESKGVKSVPMRVTCLKNEGISLSPEDFEEYMINEITDGNPYVLTEKDVEEVRKIEKGYYEPTFMRISSSNSALTERMHRVSRYRHICGLGDFSIEYDIDTAENAIKNLSISGDFFMKGDVEEMLCKPLDGVKAVREEIEKSLADICPEKVIPGLDTQTLTDILIQSDTPESSPRI